MDPGENCVFKVFLDRFSASVTNVCLTLTCLIIVNHIMIVRTSCCEENQTFSFT